MFEKLKQDHKPQSVPQHLHRQRRGVGEERKLPVFSFLTKLFESRFSDFPLESNKVEQKITQCVYKYIQYIGLMSEPTPSHVNVCFHSPAGAPACCHTVEKDFLPFTLFVVFFYLNSCSHVMFGCHTRCGCGWPTVSVLKWDNGDVRPMRHHIYEEDVVICYEYDSISCDVKSRFEVFAFPATQFRSKYFYAFSCTTCSW